MPFMENTFIDMEDFDSMLGYRDRSDSLRSQDFSSVSSSDSEMMRRANEMTAFERRQQEEQLEEQPRLSWWTQLRNMSVNQYYLALGLEIFTGLSLSTVAILTTIHESNKMDFQFYIGIVAICAGLMGIVDALRTPRRTSAFTIASAAFNFALLMLLSVVVFSILGNILSSKHMPSNTSSGHVPSNNNQSVSDTNTKPTSTDDDQAILFLYISKIFIDIILGLLSVYFCTTLSPRLYSCFKIDTLSDIRNNNEIEMRNMVQRWIAQQNEAPHIEPPGFMQPFTQVRLNPLPRPSELGHLGSTSGELEVLEIGQ